MKDMDVKGLGGSKKVVSLDKTGKAAKSTEVNKIKTVKMTGVYAQGNVEVPRQTSFVTIPDAVAANYASVGTPSEYKPYNAEQTTAFYEGLKQEGVNDTDRASDKYLEMT